MAGKARVHELAKELGVTSKEIIAQLSEKGVPVRSASSTVEAPIARSLRKAYGVASSPAKRSGANEKRPVPSKGPNQPKSSTTKQSPRRSPRKRANPADIAERYWRAATSENRKRAVNRFFGECEAVYGLSRSEVLKMFTDEQRRNAIKYLASSKNRNARSGTNRQAPGRIAPDARPTVRQPVGSTKSPSAKSADAEKAVIARPRVPSEGLPPLGASINVAAVLDVVMTNAVSSNQRTEISARLQEFSPSPLGAYGYLAWRYSAVRKAEQGGATSSTAQRDLAILAEVVDNEKQLLESLIHTHGSILENRLLAIRALEGEFQRLIDDDDVGRSVDDELRRFRNQFGFLRRSMILAIACRDNGQRLWELLSEISPPEKTQLLETTPQLERALGRIIELIPTVERLLSADEQSLRDFFLRAEAELVELHAGHYDFLLEFREIVSVPPSQTSELPFAVLPQGEVRAFLENIRSSGHYGGYYVDVHRVTVLEDLLKHFGSDRCVWHKGSPSSDGIDNRYLILSIKSADGSGEHGVAISPLAGQHATYVVRSGLADADWRILFSHPKFEARLRGARKLLFTSGDKIDQYKAMRDKIINLLECDPLDFEMRKAGRSSR